MLNRKAVKNRIDAIIKEYEDDEIGIDISEEIIRILESVNNNDMKKLTYNELLKYNGIPVWLETTPKWLRVNVECKEIKKWIIPSIYENYFETDNHLPLYFSKQNYGEIWQCYERIL